jgi:excisionase family DNA binding protein
MNDKIIEATSEHLTVREFAKKLNIHCESVRRWAREKRIRGIKAGSQWRFPSTELVRVNKEGGL